MVGSITNLRNYCNCNMCDINGYAYYIVMQVRFGQVIRNSEFEKLFLRSLINARFKGQLSIT